MKKSYFIVIDNLDLPKSKWSGFLVQLEGGGRSSSDREKARQIIEDLWMEGKLPQHYFVNGFSEDNIIMARTKKEPDRELLPIEEAGHRLIELIELVALKAQAQQEYSTISSMVEKIFTGRENELTTEEIAQAQDSKMVKNIISSLTKSIADVELTRQQCAEQSELIMGIIAMGQNGNYGLKSTEETIKETENSASSESKNNNAKTSKAGGK
ncbi:hypothetical protein M595_3508 [Lyngbya aestuarii BL J]|uniref:Uncharacterized protein n=1 Tax=Lyngbya aestuarii BL J TaxID=1348334 RepID=U7QGX3_9CYAN|nr:hypothetical protein [Lyngbya aestuarii]ERT06507.1 hypothetical protein M595_3508 [Lyngbya aestuarii BL J]